MTNEELDAIAIRLSTPHPEGLSLTKCGEQLRRDARDLLAEVLRLQNPPHEGRGLL